MDGTSQPQNHQGQADASPSIIGMKVRKLAVALVLGAGMAAIAGPVAAEAPAARKPFPTLSLPDRARGEGAVNALGGRLPEVAAWYGMTPDSFARMLREDRNAWVDRKGKLVFVDEFVAPPEAIGEVADAANISPSVPADLGLTFMLHSRPGAKRVIYLDFKGGTFTNTAWNTWPIATINAIPFTLDSDTSTFNDTELQRIQYIWQRVAEDYAPFDVDVTTEPPSTAAMTRSSSTDDTFGTRVMITQDWTSSTSSPCGCGGIAYVSAYDDTSEYYKPAWVFYNRLGSGNEKYVAEAISHEAGHNLGLSHDGYINGSTVQGYYAGHGSGATGWAPIMGVGYNKELTQWSKGEYNYATQTQDDLAIMQLRGAPLMQDDHGDTMNTATVMDAVQQGGTLVLSASGLISTRTDVDMFRFAINAGNLVLNLTPGTRGPNLDIAAGVYDANGTLIAASNPVDALNASFNLTGLPAGTYYLLVDGVGKGDPATTGYSDYASLGEYFITGSASAPNGTPPVAVASAAPVSGESPLTVSFFGTGSYDPDGGALSYDWNFGDGSAHATTANASHTYGAGNFTATLTVTDPSGISDQATVPITVTEPPAPPVSLHVSNIVMSASKNRKGVRATATVTVKDANGKLASGALVQGAWSGAASGSVSGTTSGKGTVKFNSDFSSTGGTFTFTVNGISLTGYTYDSSQNTETSDSITK